jgi:rare lipoprotein A
MTARNSAAVLLATSLLLPPLAAAAEPPAPALKKEKGAYGKPVDRSGEVRRGKASYYGREFHGRKMADGTPMNPRANIAASKTLPLGAKVEVTNLENGKSETVEIRDRGPYVDGRIIDLSPKVAEKLEMKQQGVASVEVRPIELPPLKQAGSAAVKSSGSGGTGGSSAAGN